MARRKRGRTTRRVTAQRKFAQGAHVPPPLPAAPAAPAAPERREPPLQNQDTNVFHNSITATNLLDVVCFQSSHNHLQPIVLVEKLRENRGMRDLTPPDMPLLRIRRSVPIKPKRLRNVNRPRVHVMKLRTREQRHPPQRMTPTLWATKQKRREPLNIVTTKRKRQENALHRDSQSEFSLDDNRPLTYFVNQNARKAVEQSTEPQTCMGPPSIIPPPMPAMPMPIPVRQYRLPSLSIPGSEQYLKSEVPTTISTFGHEDIRPYRPSRLSCLPPATENSCRAGSVTPVASCSTLQFPADTSSRASTSATLSRDPFAGYYSEQGIHRWIDGSLPERAVPCTPVPPVNAPSIMDDEDLRSEAIEVSDQCLAGSWKTVKDICFAPLPLFEARCKICRPCERIEKLMKITSLLKRQKRIECYTDELQQNSGRYNRLRVQKSSGARQLGQSENEEMFIELLPRHPHLMMKLKIHAVNERQIFSACFTPRSEARNGTEFSLIEHEYLLDQIIETLGSKLGDRGGAAGGCADSTKSTYGSIRAPPQPGGSGNNENAEPGSSKKADNGVPILDAPVFWPTKEEFADPIKYIEKIWEEAAKCGICKIVPPEGFEPKCNINDNIRFEVANQYIARLYSRWGPAARELCAIKYALKAQNLSFGSPPLLDGVEVNLPKLYHSVQRYGGLQNVINNRKWGKVAEDMKIVKNAKTEINLDKIYVKYLLPYDALSPEERQECMRKVEHSWNKKSQKLLERAMNPLHRQNRLLEESDSSESENEEDETDDAEDCVTPGRAMHLYNFKKVAKNLYDGFFRGQNVTTGFIEEEYWRTVILSTEHICAHTASIDTGSQGYGFSKNKEDPYLKHPWNLKNLSKHKSNLLRTLGPVLGVTVPTLHLGMLYSTSCWHRDPHSIAWADYEHIGPPKIWYSVPAAQEADFRTAAETLNPMTCQNKSIWLPSDIAMIPPHLLCEQNVTLYRAEQNPGEFVVVMPGAYSCSISTGYTVSESTYFATESWLDEIMNVFKVTRESCEPTMFSIEQFLLHLAEDPDTNARQLRKIQPMIREYFNRELQHRAELHRLGVNVINPEEQPSTSTGRRRRRRRNTNPVYDMRDQDECEICRRTLYLSKVRHLPHRDSVVCPEHALKLIERRNKSGNPVDPKEIELDCMVSNAEVHGTIELVDERLEQLSAAGDIRIEVHDENNPPPPSIPE